ncbi:MAG: response regulator [Ruminococcus sp.]
MIENKQIDVLITDIEMPEDSGIDLLKWIKPESEKIWYVFSSPAMRIFYL